MNVFDIAEKKAVGIDATEKRIAGFHCLKLTGSFNRILLFLKRKFIFIER